MASFEELYEAYLRALDTGDQTSAYTTLSFHQDFTPDRFRVLEDARKQRVVSKPIDELVRFQGPSGATKASLDALKDAYINAPIGETQQLAAARLTGHPDFRASMWSEMDAEAFERRLAEPITKQVDDAIATGMPVADEDALRRSIEAKGRPLKEGTTPFSAKWTDKEIAAAGWTRRDLDLLGHLGTYQSYTKAEDAFIGRPLPQSAPRRIPNSESSLLAGAGDDIPMGEPPPPEEWVDDAFEAQKSSLAPDVGRPVQPIPGLQPEAPRGIPTAAEHRAARAQMDSARDVAAKLRMQANALDAATDPGGHSALMDEFVSADSEAARLSKVVSSHVEAMDAAGVSVKDLALEPGEEPIPERRREGRRSSLSKSERRAAAKQASDARRAAAKTEEALQAAPNTGERFKWIPEGYQKWVRPQVTTHGLRTAGIAAGVGAVGYYLHQRKRDKEFDDVTSHQGYEDGHAYARYKKEMREPVPLMMPSRKMNPLVTAELTGNMDNRKIGHHNMAPDKNNYLFGGL